MTRLSDQLQLRPCSCREEREGRFLFVWGDVGQWLVVDADAARLIQCFGRRTSVGEAIAQYARQVGRPNDEVTKDAVGVVETLLSCGLLGQPPFAAAVPPDPLRMSNLTFNIANRCNLACPWCYNAPTARGEVPISDVVRWLEEGRSGLDDDAAFLILGGEPFLDQQRLVECVRGVRPCMAGEILVSTNGTHDPHACVSALADARVTVQISLDGARRETHDRVRSAGVFDQAIETAHILVQAGIHTVFSMVLRRENVAEMEKYCELATDVGVNEVRFIPLRRIGRGTTHAEAVPDLCGAFGQLVDILQRRPVFGRLVGRDFFSILMTVCRFSHLRDNCGMGRRCLFMNADGSLFPCPNHCADPWCCGQVRTSPLASILRSSSVLQSLRDTYRVEQFSKCRECGVRFWCAGDCRAEALSVSGSATAPSPYCGALQAIIPQMFWLIADGWDGPGSRSQEVRPWS